MKAGARYVGSVVLTMKVESWAASETANNNSSEPATDAARWGVAGSPNITPRSSVAHCLEPVPHRHLQGPWQNRTGEEQAARKPAHEAQARVALFQTDRLIGVEQVGPDGDAIRRNDVLRAQVEIGVGGELVIAADSGRAPPVHEMEVAVQAHSRPAPVGHREVANNGRNPRQQGSDVGTFGTSARARRARRVLRTEQRPVRHGAEAAVREVTRRLKLEAVGTVFRIGLNDPDR